jgi:O-antigen/teichoic acid export membrane protein
MEQTPAGGAPPDVTGSGPGQLPAAPLPPRAEVSTGARLVRNVLALGTGQAFTLVFSSVLTVLLPRYLGDERLGRIATAGSLTGFCGLIASLGISTYLAKEVARHGPRGHLSVLNALITRAPLTAAACLLAVVAAALLGYDPLTRRLVAIYCLGMVFGSVAGVLVGTLQGLQEMRWVALGDVVGKGLLLAGVSAVIWGDHGLLALALVWQLASLGSIAVYLVPLSRRGALAGTPDRHGWRRLVTGSMPFFIWQAALMVYGQIDVVLLSIFTHAAVVGWYSAAYRIIGIPTFIPVIITNAAYPALSQSAGRSGTAFRTLARRSLHVVLLLTIPVAVGIMVIAGPLLAFFGYPEEFRNSIPLVMILALTVPLVAADMVLAVTINALDRQRAWALSGVAAAVLNPAVNLAAIPFFERHLHNGAIGAAIVTVLTEVFMMVMGLRLLRGAVFDRSSVRFALKCVAAALVMAAVVWLARGMFLPLTVALGAGVYFAASFALGTLSVHDVRLLRTYVLNWARARAPTAA